MKAMVLAAGLGTRLRPLTNERPKALVEIAGRTLLEIALQRLKAFGVREAVVNTHHFAEMIPAYLAKHENFGMRIEISHETVLLDTGGGLKQAAWFFLEGKDPQPFLLHNVDVMSTIDLDCMVRFHKKQNALATMAVQRRETSRPLLFDREGLLRGRGLPSASRPVPSATRVATDTGNPPLQELAFSGIHVLSPGIFARLEETGAFSIIDAYLRLAAGGEKIVAFHADAYRWRDLGRPEHLLAAERETF
jgi:NDP-sugar pyrophosphorylase family protein